MESVSKKNTNNGMVNLKQSYKIVRVHDDANGNPVIVPFT